MENIECTTEFYGEGVKGLWGGEAASMDYRARSPQQCGTHSPLAVCNTDICWGIVFFLCCSGRTQYGQEEKKIGKIFKNSFSNPVSPYIVSPIWKIHLGSQNLEWASQHFVALFLMFYESFLLPHNLTHGLCLMFFFPNWYFPLKKYYHRLSTYMLFPQPLTHLHILFSFMFIIGHTVYIKILFLNWITALLVWHRLQKCRISCLYLWSDSDFSVEAY